MKAVVQRVNWAKCVVEGKVTGKIKLGLLVYVGVAKSDGPKDAHALAAKIAKLRIFEDQNEKMNLSVQDVDGKILVIPNFTLQADTRKGRRPSFTNSAGPKEACELFDKFVQELQHQGCGVQTGIFQAEMFIDSQSAGPVNVIVDSDELLQKNSD